MNDLVREWMGYGLVCKILPHSRLFYSIQFSLSLSLSLSLFISLFPLPLHPPLHLFPIILSLHLLLPALLLSSPYFPTPSPPLCRLKRKKCRPRDINNNSNMTRRSHQARHGKPLLYHGDGGIEPATMISSLRLSAALAVASTT
jgi:hypothetical protein